MGEIKLLGSWASPFALRVQIALDLKSVKYEIIEETFVPKSELLLKSNPIHKKVPVLFINDKTLIESVVIVQYIDEVYSSGPSILPSDPYQRATHRFWTAYIDDKWFPTYLHEVFHGKTPEEKATALAGAKEGIVFLEEAFIKLSNGKPFFGGDEIGLLDITLGSFLGWLRAGEKFYGLTLLDEANAPTLAAWADRFYAHDAVKNNMPDTDKLVEFAKIITATPH